MEELQLESQEAVVVNASQDTLETIVKLLYNVHLELMDNLV
jgi:hypothetical protein